jgi:glycosyltransferase involved in cell wall biosynthesis
MSKIIHILHEYDSRNHFKGLYYLCSKNNIQVKFKVFNFSIRKIIGLIRFSIINNNFDRFYIYIKSFLSFDFVFAKNRVYVIGIAPFDWRIIKIFFLSKRNKIYYFTSWDWSNTSFPKKYFFEFLLFLWYKFIKNRISGVVAVSNKTKLSFANRFNFPLDKIHVVYHSISEPNQFFTPKNYNGILNFIFVGILEKNKGIHLLEDFINSLNSVNINFTINIVGVGSFKREIKKISYKYTNVIYHGYLDKKSLNVLYNSSHFLLLPSQRSKNWEEVFGMVITEAMNFGVIPITTDHVGPREIITNRKNGFYFSEKEYLKGLLKTLSLSDKELKLISRNAFIESKKYVIDNISKKWKFILENGTRNNSKL